PQPHGAAPSALQKDSVFPGQRVVLVDDVLATGGTAEAGIKLIESLGGKVVKVLVLVELAGLEGRKKLAGYDVAAALTFPGKCRF
ncbi:MAG: adenine phosphoribosyltransferase, partial [Clostridiales bacterium]|nr:adenine phosphoribosyltransferase [Clostridiales bacterium]